MVYRSLATAKFPINIVHERRMPKIQISNGEQKEKKNAHALEKIRLYRFLMDIKLVNILLISMMPNYNCCLPYEYVAFLQMQNFYICSSRVA